MNTRTEVINGQQVVIQMCPPGPQPKQLSVKGKATKVQRWKKLKRLSKWKESAK